MLCDTNEFLSTVTIYYVIKILTIYFSSEKNIFVDLHICSIDWLKNIYLILFEFFNCKNIPLVRIIELIVYVHL